MVEKSEFIRKKCAEVFIVSDGNFSLICELCGDESFAFKDFRHHTKYHFPETQMIIKRERSISFHSDFESDEKDNLAEEAYQPAPIYIKTEASNSYSIESEPNPAVILQVDVGSQTSAGDFLLVPERSDTRKNEEGKKITKRRRNTESPPCCDVAAAKRLAGDSSKNRKRKFQCSFCSKFFGDKWNLNSHENIHTGKRPFKCDFCAKTFIQSQHLSCHIKSMHTKDRQSACLVCDKKFINVTQLDLHNREKHLPDSDPRRYFPCKLCDFKFKSHTQLGSHMLRVHKKKSDRFICYYCKQEFSCRNYIVKHMPIHAGSNNYKCQYCNKMYGQASGKWGHELYCVAKRSLT